MNEEKGHIKPGMTVLDIITKYRETEAVFKKYDKKAGECVCCHSLFDTLQVLAEKYRLDLSELIDDLDTVIKGT